MPIFIVAISLVIGIVPNIQKNNKSNHPEEYTITEEENSIKETDEINLEGTTEWKIEIPAISLTANISEGIDEQTLNKYVGHFSATPKIEGNVGLAAHNRGYEVNYFANLKYLKGGEEIIYTYGEITKTYVVEKNIKISEIDWSYLENSNKNKITLITCIENQPEYRRCIQATEKEET